TSMRMSAVVPVPCTCSCCVKPYAVPVCFFFSSRRRHTRSKRDWSSDVCSSDLLASSPPAFQAGPERRRARCQLRQEDEAEQDRRSEERRVGKECRPRGWREE